MTKGLIPSIHTLFRDIQYLEDYVNCVKRLTTVSPRENLANTMKRKFTGVNQRQGQLKLQISEDKFIYRKGTPQDQIDYGYRQLHAFAMRYWPDMPKEPEKEDPRIKAPTRANLVTLRRFANLATELGFKSDQITKLRQHRERENTPAAVPPQSKPALVTSGKGVPLKNRCGKQTTREFKEDRQFLFISNLHNKWEEHGNNITSFFVRKSVYLAFFGELSTIYDGSWRDKSSPGSNPQSVGGSTPGAGADISHDLPINNMGQSHQSQHSIGIYDNILTLYQQTSARNI
jgi:hypothetical protein